MNVKKYIGLIGATAVVCGLVFAVSSALRESLPEVETVKLAGQTIEQTVLCTGKVEEATAAVKAVAAAGQTVQVRVAVPESRLKQVAVGQRAAVSGTAFSESVYTGTVVSLGNTAYVASSGSTVVDAVIALDTTDETLRCGLTAKAGICVSREEGGLLVPYAALWEDEDGQEYVYVVKGYYAHRRAVTTGTELTDGVQVTEGLREGERVVEEYAAIPADGARVRVKKE